MIPKGKSKLAAIIPFYFMLLILETAVATNIDFIVTIPKIIPDGTITQYDVFGTGTGKEFFTIILDNRGNLVSDTGLRIRYNVDYYPPDISKNAKLLIKNKYDWNLYQKKINTIYNELLEI